MSNIEFDIRYLTFDLNVGLSLIFIFDIQFECRISNSNSIFDIQNLNVEYRISN